MNVVPIYEDCNLATSGKEMEVLGTFLFLAPFCFLSKPYAFLRWIWMYPFVTSERIVVEAFLSRTDYENGLQQEGSEVSNFGGFLLWAKDNWVGRH